MKKKAHDLVIGDRIPFSTMVLTIEVLEKIEGGKIYYSAGTHDDAPVMTPGDGYYHASSFSANRIVNSDTEIEVIE